MAEKLIESKTSKISVSAHVGPSAQPPIDLSGNFQARVSVESPSNIFLNPSEVISEVSELHDKSFLDIFESSQFCSQNRVNWGERGVVLSQGAWSW